MRTLLDLAQDSPAAATTLASMGQRYQDYPAASFDQRFGPYEVGPAGTDDARQQLRRMFEYEQLRRTPGGVVPGTKTFPFGYTLAGDVTPLPILRLPGVGPQQGQTTGYDAGNVQPFYPYTPGGENAFRQYLERISRARRGG